MIELIKDGVYLVDGQMVKGGDNLPTPDAAREETIAYQIMPIHKTIGRIIRREKMRFFGL